MMRRERGDCHRLGNVMPLLFGLISLLLGLLAWVLPVLVLVKHESKNRFYFSIASVSACAISLFTYILHANYEISENDWSALGDWAEAIHLPTVLLVVTLALNLAVVVKGDSHRFKGRMKNE